MKIMGDSKITPMTPLDVCGKGKKPSASPTQKAPFDGPHAAPINGHVSGTKNK